MEFGRLFECGMLVCFGFSWPLNVIKAYKARTAKGTSLAFIILIITGYVAGIAAKFINHQFNYVLAVYFLNLVIVFANVIVYFRNKSLDSKNQSKLTKKKLLELQSKYKNSSEAAYTYSQEENAAFAETEKAAEKNGVILFGGEMDSHIPVEKLSEAFGFNFSFCNRSVKNLSASNASEVYFTEISKLKPEGLLIHLGENDAELFAEDKKAFDSAYINLIENIRKDSEKCRIALVSVNNPEADKAVSDMNKHIESIADSESCDFINLDNVKLWNPEATKAASDFAYSMGLRGRKPLRNVAEIVYSYAYLEIKPEADEAEKSETLAG